MTIQELTPFLQKVSADILVLALITYFITNIIKHYIPEKYKNKVGLVPFVLGILLSGIYSLIAFKGIDCFTIIKKGIQTGGIATFIYAFIKQLLKKDNLEKTLTDILRGIIDSTTLKSTVAKIVKDYNTESSLEEKSNEICKVITESTNFSEEECKTISEIIVNALNTK